LHVHLDGSIRVATLIDLAKEIGMELPSYDEAELRRLVFKDNYKNLEVCGRRVVFAFPSAFLLLFTPVLSDRSI
jgi:adenosine deaminase